MKSRKKIAYLVSLLKVFDVNFVNEEDYAKISGLNVNGEVDVRKAIHALMIPEFAYYSPVAQKRMLGSLRAYLSDDVEDFSELFDRIELIFDEYLLDRRRFMSIIQDEWAQLDN
ncbi:hypothetical protein [Comamonas sp. JUb58]|uniref:hypothetical protein n=1 Tax=Comamonas sp. JUb58 TaxID=2485114 RepID=UPI00105FFED1|nr:hypothetical protein [Comamonas sp. JUb58]